MIKNKIPLPRDRGAWQGPEMSFPLLSFRCAAGAARRETVAKWYWPAAAAAVLVAVLVVVVALVTALSPRISHLAVN